MAIINKINLDGESYDLQDSATLQAVENVTDAVNGKSTAEITYNTSEESLDITTSKITVSQPTESEEDINTARASGLIKSINLNGDNYSVGADGAGYKVMDTILGTINFAAGDTVKMTPFVTVLVPTDKIISVTPIITSGMSYPVAISVSPGSNASRSSFGAAAFSNGLDPASIQITARILYTE